MEKSKLFLPGILLLFVLISCSSSNGQEQGEKFSDEEALFRQYAFLTQESYYFSESNGSFREQAFNYIDTCSSGIPGYKLLNDNMRFKEPTILEPYLFNNDKSKAWVLILMRDKDLKGKPVEYVEFVLATKEGDDWSFNLKKGYSRSFSYGGYKDSKHPILSEQFITLRILRQLIDQGYMDLYSNQINDNFFDKDW